LIDDYDGYSPLDSLRGIGQDGQGSEDVRFAE